MGDVDRRICRKRPDLAKPKKGFTPGGPKPFSHGGVRPGSGRKVGSSNRIRNPYSVRTWKWLNRVINKAGGEDRLIEVAKKNDEFFMKLCERRDYMSQKADQEQAKANKEKPIELPDAESFEFEQSALPDGEEIDIEEYTHGHSDPGEYQRYEKAEVDALQNSDNSES